MEYRISDFSVIIVAASVSLALVQYFRSGFKEFLDELKDNAINDFNKILSDNSGGINKEALDKEYEKIKNAKCDLFIWQQSILFFIILSSVFICAVLTCPFCSMDVPIILEWGIFIESIALTSVLMWVFFNMTKEFKIKNSLKEHSARIKTGATIFTKLIK